MMKVLLVDDEKEFADYMRKRLERRDMEVQVVHSGEEALTYINKNPVDVIILDMLMPGMSGTETLKHVKEQRPETEVVMLTGHGTIESAVEGIKLGAYEYLLKPCDLDDLIKTINDAFARKLETDERRLSERVALAILSPRSSVKSHKD
ncbi:MAG: response regulator [Myxococcales bacterium]|nr:MAG: response regulator [Myxococcales bacterium]